MSLAKKLSALPAGRQRKTWTDKLTTAQRAEVEGARSQYWAKDHKRGVSVAAAARLIASELSVAVNHQTIARWLNEGQP